MATVTALLVSGSPRRIRPLADQQSAAFVRAELKPTRSLIVARNVFMNTIATNRIFLILAFACAIFAGNGEARVSSCNERRTLETIVLSNCGSTAEKSLR